MERCLDNSTIAITITMAIVFLQVMQSTGFKYDCHRNCVCIVWKNLAECSQQNLTRLPESIPVHYTYVNLRNNNISLLVSGDFEKAALLHLKSLDMSCCNLHTVQSGAFHGMIHLEELNLNNNFIKTLHSNAFCGAMSLAELSIASNLIQIVQPNAFCGIQSLKMLNLKNNSINKMEEHMFRGLTGLTTVSLRGNNILQMPAEIFVGVKNLTFLDLSYNNISTISKTSLIGLDKLLILYLPSNNSFCCDCESKNTFMWLTEHNVSVIGACSVPKKTYGLQLQAMLNVSCNGTGIQDITTALPNVSIFHEPETSLLAYALTVFVVLTLFLAIIIGLYKYFIEYQQEKQQRLSSQRYRASTQTIETES